MKQGWSALLHIWKLCLPIFCFQTEELSLGGWLLQQFQSATPIMAYVDTLSREEENLNDLAASENRQALGEDANEGLEPADDANGGLEPAEEAVTPQEQEVLEVTPQEDPNLQSMAAQENSPWKKQVEINRNKLLDYDYVMQNFYRADRTTTIDSSEFHPQELLEKNLAVDLNVQGPVVLIYHTHSQESFADSDGTENMSVMALGERLASLLQNVYGIPTMHHLGKYDVDGRDYAYSNAAPEIKRVLAENPSIQVVIDLHRDGVDGGTRLVTEVNGKPTAKIMFFNGLSKTTSTGEIDYLKNPYIQDNLAMSFQMQIAAAELYPGFTRPVFLKGYRYNMHLCPKSMLIEVGAQTNTYEEVYNAMEPLANILSFVLLGNH